MEYTLIGGPLFGDDGYYYSEMTIKKLLKDKRNCWSLEILGFAEEHICIPFYDSENYIRFDELPVIPTPVIQVGLFDEVYSNRGTLVVTYEDEEEDNVLRWHRWIRQISSVTFIFRKLENNILQKMWIFHDVRSCDTYDTLYGLDDLVLEFHFGRFENKDLQPPKLKYNVNAKADF